MFGEEVRRNARIRHDNHNLLNEEYTKFPASCFDEHVEVQNQPSKAVPIISLNRKIEPWKIGRRSKNEPIVRISGKNASVIFQQTSTHTRKDQPFVRASVS